MRGARLGCLTGTGLVAALITALVIAGFAVASGGPMFSPGALNALHGQPLGGVTSHADIAGACSACHAAKDAHNGQFGTNCESCHTPSGWGSATFDHNNTAFPLIGKHSRLECSKCHSSGVYRGTPSQCVPCHEDKHNGKTAPIAQLAIPRQIGVT